jgi:predicted nucleic acid-binding protein
VSRALLDTSVVIAASDGDGELPPTAAISVVTLGELHAGVHRAPDAALKAARVQRLANLRAAFMPLPVDEDVAAHYGRALARARDERRSEKVADLLIIATAAATERELHTRDERQAKLARRTGLVVHGPGG